MTTATAPRERLNAEERKQQIVQVVLRLVAKHGADAVSTQQIADTIGFTQAAVFRHFPTKEDIWSAVMDWLDVQLRAVRETARAAPDSGIGVLERMFFGHIALIERHPGLAKVIMSDHIRRQSPNLHQRFAASHRKYENDIRSALDAAARNGEIPDSCDREAAVTLFLCAIQGLGFQFSIARVRPSLRQDASHVFKLFVRGLKAEKLH